MTEIQEDLLYTKTHEWLRVDGKNVEIGVTDYAQEQLTDIVYVEDLPEPGDDMELGDTVCVLNSVKSASDVYTPIAGEVLEANGDLEEEPERINESPYERGWLVKLAVQSLDKSLFMNADEYNDFLLTL